MTANKLIPGLLPQPADDHDDVRRWRQERLLVAGFPPALAAGLAAAPDVDLHALLGLVDRGCPPVLAARILGPDQVPGT